MRFLLFLLFLFPVFAFSATYMVGDYSNLTGSTPEEACQKYTKTSNFTYVSATETQCVFKKFDFNSTIDIRKVPSKCRDSQQIVNLDVRNPQLQSMCYEGCTYVPAPSTGCVSVEGEVGWACRWVQRATECDAPNGTYSGSSKDKDDKNKDKDKDGKDKDAKDKDPKETPQCKEGKYDPTDPYYTRCPNRDKDGNDISNQKPPTSNITPTIGEDGGNGTGNDTKDKDGKDKDGNSNDKDKDGQSDKDGKDEDAEEDGKDEVDLSGLKENIPVEDISSKLKLNFNLFQTSGTCPSHSFTLQLGSMSKVININYKYLCDVLRVLGYIVTIGACLHATSIIVRDT